MATVNFGSAETGDDEFGRLSRWVAYPVVGFLCLVLWAVIIAMVIIRL